MTNTITFDSFMKSKDTFIRIHTTDQFDILSDAICARNGKPHPDYYHNADNWLGAGLKTNVVVVVGKEGYIHRLDMLKKATVYDFSDVLFIPRYMPAPTNTIDPKTGYLLHSKLGTCEVNHDDIMDSIKYLLGEADDNPIVSITVNEPKKIVTVVFQDDDVRMSKCSENDDFDPRVGVAMCIAYHCYGSKTKFAKAVDKATKIKTKTKKEPTK